LSQVFYSINLPALNGGAPLAELKKNTWIVFKHLDKFWWVNRNNRFVLAISQKTLDFITKTETPVCHHTSRYQHISAYDKEEHYADTA